MQIGKFEIVRQLGEGGMGTVFEARDPELSRSVAVKVLRDPSSNPVRLLREAQALARITHANVVAVYELGTHEGAVFIAMQLIEGVTIDRYIADRKCTWREVIALYAQAGRGLTAVHEQNLVHRDFKPSNVLVDGNGTVRVGDFGLARRDDDVSTISSDAAPATVPFSSTAVTVDAVTADGPTAIAGDDTPAPPQLGLLDAPITAHGAIVGTPHYMAPEQRAGDRVTRHADQYSFAFTLQEALENRDAPKWVDRVLARALAKNPTARYPSMSALLDALAAVPRRRRRIAVALGSSVAAIGVTAAFLLLRGGPSVDCTAAGASVSTTWSAAARAAIVAGFTAAKSSETAALVTAGIDRWTGRWRDTRVDACRATHERGEQSANVLDGRVACLDRGLASASALLETLAHPDRPALESAVAAVDALPAPEACTAARVVGTGAIDPRTATVDRAIADADTALALRSADVVALADRALASARKLGEPGPIARALAVHARAVVGADAARARIEIDEAQTLAAASRDPGLEAEVLYIAVDMAVAHDTAERVDALVPATRGAIERAGSPPPLLRRLATVEFYAAMKNRRIPEAKLACEKMIERALPEDHDRISANCKCRIAIVTRDPVEVVPACDAALVETREHFGENHPLTADAINNLVVALGRASKTEEAHAKIEELGRVYLAIYGEKSSQMSSYLRYAAGTASEQGNYAEARKMLERALAIVDEIAPHEAGRAGLLLELAGYAGQLGDTASAVKYAEQGRRAAETELGPDSTEMATILIIYATAIVVDPNEHTRATTACDQAIAIADKAPAGTTTILGTALVECSSLRLGLAQYREALALARRGLPILEGSGDARMAGRDQYVIGHALLQLGQRAEATTALLDAKKRLTPEGDTEYLAMIEKDLTDTPKK